MCRLDLYWKYGLWWRVWLGRAAATENTQRRLLACRQGSGGSSDPSVGDKMCRFRHASQASVNAPAGHSGPPAAAGQTQCSAQSYSVVNHVCAVTYVSEHVQLAVLLVNQVTCKIINKYIFFCLFIFDGLRSTVKSFAINVMSTSGNNKMWLKIAVIIFCLLIVFFQQSDGNKIISPFWNRILKSSILA